MFRMQRLALRVGGLSAMPRAACYAAEASGRERQPGGLAGLQIIRERPPARDSDRRKQGHRMPLPMGRGRGSPVQEWRRRKGLPQRREEKPADVAERPRRQAIVRETREKQWPVPSLREEKLRLHGEEKRAAQMANHKYRQNPAMQLRDLALQGKATEALELFQGTSKELLRRDSFVFNNLILACSRQGAWKKSFKVYNSMKKHSVQPDAKTFSMLLDCLSRMTFEPGMTQEERVAWTREKLDFVADEMHKKDVQPSTRLYNVVFKALAAVGDMAGALSLVKELDMTAEKAGAKGGEDAKRMPQADLMTYTTLIKFFGAKDLEQAFVLWDQMRANKRIRPDSRFYNALASACMKHDKPEVALEVLESMEVPADTVTLTHVTAAYAALGRPAYAPVILKQAEDEGIPLDDFLLSSLLRLGTMKGWEMRSPPAGSDCASAAQFLDKMEQKLLAASRMRQLPSVQLERLMIAASHAVLPEAGVRYYEQLRSQGGTVAPTAYDKMEAVVTKHGDAALLRALQAARRTQ